MNVEAVLTNVESLLTYPNYHSSTLQDSMCHPFSCMKTLFEEVVYEDILLECQC